MHTPLRHRIAALLIVPLLLAACATDEKPRVGNQAVYDRIDALTTCDELQTEFDTAMDNVERRQPGDPLRDVSLAYATYADARMRAGGCFD